MSCFSSFDISVRSEQIGRTKVFRKSGQVRSSPDVLARQVKLSTLAFGAYSERAEALTFLNTHCVTLRGRPLDIAGMNDEGLAASIAALHAVRS